MNVSTRKTLRTVYQALVAIAAMTSLAVPVFNMNFPKYAAVGGSILGGIAVFTKVTTALEQRGIIGKVLDPAKAPDAGQQPAPVVVTAEPPATINPAAPYVGTHEAGASNLELVLFVVALFAILAFLRAFGVI